MHILILLAASSDSGENLGTYIYIYISFIYIVVYTAGIDKLLRTRVYRCHYIGRAYIMIAS